MKFSKKSRYGLVALIDLALRTETKYVTLGLITKKHDLSTQYLEQIFGSLRRGGVVDSIKGPQGGYRLSRPMEDIFLTEILQALEGDYLLEEEKGKGKIFQAIQNRVIEPVNDELQEMLKGISLKDLVEEYQSLESGSEMMYYI